MKAKSFVVSSIMIFITSSCFSQIVNSGIYFTAEDYVTQKLSFAINCKTEKHKIKSDLIFHPKEISIKHNDSTYTYPKDSIYGIKYCDGSVVRIYNNSEYPLLNPSETILIYKVVSIVPGKTSRSEKKYYFSKDYKSKIEILSIDNIKSAFPDNHKFHDLIDEGFRNDNDLRDYDNFHKIMKINRVLQKSLEVK
jgi:hypothetical protein